MSFTFGFYNALNHDRRYDAKEMSRIFDGLLTDGVYPTIGNKMMVRSSEEDNSVIVGSGRAWFNHSWNLNDADIPLTGPASHILYPRWDAVVLDINSSNEYRTNSIIWVTGTAASTPAKPAMIHTEDHNQYPLAYIYRISNNNAISDADITNTIGSDECPYAAGLLVDRKNIAQVEDNDYATKAYAFGEYIIWYDQLYKVTTPILKGVKIVAYPTSGYNVKSTMIATELYEKLVFDTVPTNGSQHAVTSDGIYKALGNHSSIQTTSSVTSGSGSLITSGGIYTALGNRTSIQTSAPTQNSNNLITSGQVYTALGNRTAIATSAPTSGSNNLITSGQVYTALGNRTSIATSAPASGGTNLITNGQVYAALGNRTAIPTNIEKIMSEAYFDLAYGGSSYTIPPKELRPITFFKPSEELWNAVGSHSLIGYTTVNGYMNSSYVDVIIVIYSITQFRKEGVKGMGISVLAYNYTGADLTINRILVHHLGYISF